MATRTITGLTALQCLWLETNFDEGLTDALYNASGVEVSNTFKCTNDNSTSTDLNDVFFEFIIDNYADRDHINGYGYQLNVKNTLRPSQIEQITTGREIEEIVIYYNKDDNTNYTVDVSVNFDDVTLQRPVYSMDGSNAFESWCAIVKDTDGNIIDYSINWSLDLNNENFTSNYQWPNATPCPNYPREFVGDKVANAFPYKGNMERTVAINGYYYNIMQKSHFHFSHKAFSSKAKAIAYLKYGIDDSIGEEGESGEPAQDRIKTLYYNSTVYSRLYNDSVVNRVGPSSINIDIQYKTNSGETLVNPQRAICGYVNTDNEPNNDTYFGNIHWIVKQGVKIIECNTNRINGASKTYTGSMPSWAESTGFQGPYIDGNTIYESRYNTNMYIFANRTDAEAYLTGLNPKPIGGGSNSGSFNPDEFVGDPTEYNVGHDLQGGGMSSCWIMNESGLEDLASLFATGLTKVESASGDIILNITKTAARSFASHAEPIDAVVDLFWIPVDPSGFYTQGASYFEIGKDDLSSASSIIKLTAESGDTFVGIGQKVDQAGNNILNNSFNLIGNKIQGISDNTNVTVTERSMQ